MTHREPWRVSTKNGLDSTLKACKTVCVLCKLFRQRIDSNFTTEFRVACTPHFTHAASA